MCPPQSHTFDRMFYDRSTHRYTARKWASDLEERYGGVDSVLLWSTYTNIGVDDRNQWDLTRLSAPGFREAIDELHSMGIRVLLPYNPWDQFTHPEGVPDEVALARLAKELHADGFNGDVMKDVPLSFYAASVDVGHPLAIEPELGGTLEMLNWATMGWGYWMPYSHIPGVDRWKWLEPRRMTHVCWRWGKDKTDELQHAWFNGDGFVSWENVWGTWNGFTKRDAEALRRISAMERFFGARGHLVSKGWRPHFPMLHPADVFSSMWPANGDTLWTVVNRGSLFINDRQIELKNDPGMHYYDCYLGKEIIPEVVSPATITISFPIESRGYGCAFATIKSVKPGDGSEFGEFLQMMAVMTKQPLNSYSPKWNFLTQIQEPIKPTVPVAQAPSGMVMIPAGPFHFVSTSVVIEGGGDEDNGVDVQMPWEDHPKRNHDKRLDMASFFIDKYPVTNADYAAYLKKTGYTPIDNRNFLRHWKNGTFPDGWDDKPVTFVSIAEARLYCQFYAKRLPHETEWAYAAQGTDGRLYPWGNTKDQSRFPVATHGRTHPGPESVHAHEPAGDSPFGVSDLVGNVWQYTDEYQDTHTSAAVLRGSANYRPDGSEWYFPEALELNKHEKYMLFDDAFERAGTIGFRCAVDAK